MDEDYRITVTLDREVNKRLDAQCPWGMKTQVIRSALELLADFIEKHGKVGIALILEGRMELRAKEQNVKARGSRKDR